MRYRFLPAVAIFLLTVIAFVGAVTDGHLHLDDWGYTYGCAFVKDGFSFANVLHAFRDIGNGGIWMPLTSISYMLDISLFGGSWRVNHAINVVLHGFNAALVFAFLLAVAKRIVGDAGARLVWPCLIGALLWSLHPMRAEAVVWVASRKEELWGFFVLLASLTWMSFLEKGGARRYLLVGALFILSCLSKPTAVCFPVVALLIQFCLFGEKRFQVWHYVPLFGISAVVGMIAILSQSNPTGMERIDFHDASTAWCLLNAAVSLGLYVVQTIVPAGIHMDYRAVFGGWPLKGTLGLVAVAVAVAVAVLAAWRLRHRPTRHLPLFVCGWFVITVMPVLGLLGVTGDKAYADRYTYLPAVSVSLAVAVLLALLRQGDAAQPQAPRPSPLSRQTLAANVCVAAFLAMEIWVLMPVVRSFASDYLAYSRVLRYDPEHWRALRVVGCEYCARQNRMDEGIAMLKRSLDKRPSQQTASTLAYTLACRGKGDDFAEVKRLGGAVAATPSLDKGGMMLDALGITAMREGDDASAVRYFSAALVAPRRTHSNIHSMLNLGLSLANLGRRNEAAKFLSKLKGVANDDVRTRASDAIQKLSQGETARFSWK